MAALVCRQCRSVEIADLGALPECHLFAGQALVPPWPGGRLHRCCHCHLGFRHPLGDEQSYEKLYGQASSEVWISTELRRDQALVRDRVEALAGAVTVLDVGCYDGALLASLSARFKKFGVEASAAAAEAAAQRGIQVVAAKFSDIDTLAQQYDVICAVDVIEHVADPRAFVASLAQKLAAGGTLLVSTGNIESRAWRMAGGHYWYSSFPEHISFVSPAWAQQVSQELGLQLVDVQNFTYSAEPGAALAQLRRRFFRKLLSTRLRAALRAWWPQPTARQRSVRVLGAPGLFEDHTLLSFCRPEVQAAWPP